MQSNQLLAYFSISISVTEHIFVADVLLYGASHSDVVVLEEFNISGLVKDRLKRNGVIDWPTVAMQV